MASPEQQAGLTVAVSSPLLTAPQTVGQMGKAVGRSTTLAVEKVKEIADDLKSESARAALHGIVGCASAAGAIVVAELKGEDPTIAAVGAAAGAQAGAAIGGLAKSVATPAVSDAFGVIAGALISEGTTTTIPPKKNG